MTLIAKDWGIERLMPRIAEVNSSSSTLTHKIASMILFLLTIFMFGVVVAPGGVAQWFLPLAMN